MKYPFQTLSSLLKPSFFKKPTLLSNRDKTWLKEMAEKNSKYYWQGNKLHKFNMFYDKVIFIHRK